MYCRKCGKFINYDSEFCVDCAKKIAQDAESAASGSSPTAQVSNTDSYHPIPVVIANKRALLEKAILTSPQMTHAGKKNSISGFILSLLAFLCAALCLATVFIGGKSDGFTLIFIFVPIPAAIALSHASKAVTIYSKRFTAKLKTLKSTLILGIIGLTLSALALTALPVSIVIDEARDDYSYDDYSYDDYPYGDDYGDDEWSGSDLLNKWSDVVK